MKYQSKISDISTILKTHLTIPANLFK